MESRDKNNAEQKRKPEKQEQTTLFQTKRTESYGPRDYEPIEAATLNQFNKEKPRKNASVFVSKVNNGKAETNMVRGSMNLDSGSEEALTATVQETRDWTKRKQVDTHGITYRKLHRAANNLKEACLVLTETDSARGMKILDGAAGVVVLSAEAFLKATVDLALESISSGSTVGKDEPTKVERQRLWTFLDKLEILVVQYNNLDRLEEVTGRTTANASACSHSPMKRLERLMASALSTAMAYVEQLTRNLCLRSDVLETAFELAKYIEWSSGSESENNTDCSGDESN